MPKRFRPAGSRCGHPSPDLLDIPETLISMEHKLGYYLSTYCEHGLGSDCRGMCKTCHLPCACQCHGEDGPVPDGFSIKEEDRMRAVAKRIAREKGVLAGPRGDELIASIVTGVLFYADWDAAEDDAVTGHVEYGPLDPSTRELIAKATSHHAVREVIPEYMEGEWE